MLDNNQKSSVGELEVLTDLSRNGFEIFLPLNGASRTDAIVVHDGTPYKIQIKYRALKSTGVIVLTNGNPNGSNHNKNVRYNIGDFDVLAVYCPETDSCYYIPAEEMIGSLTAMNLRVNPTKNNQSTGVRWAKNYTNFPL